MAKNQNCIAAAIVIAVIILGILFVSGNLSFAIIKHEDFIIGSSGTATLLCDSSCMDRLKIGGANIFTTQSVNYVVDNCYGNVITRGTKSLSGMSTKYGTGPQTDITFTPTESCVRIRVDFWDSSNVYNAYSEGWEFGARSPAPVSYCGDGKCDANENCSTCSSDCGTCKITTPYCGDSVCNGKEDCSTCSKDCGKCPAKSDCPYGCCLVTDSKYNVKVCPATYNCINYTCVSSCVTRAPICGSCIINTKLCNDGCKDFTEGCSPEEMCYTPVSNQCIEVLCSQLTNQPTFYANATCTQYVQTQKPTEVPIYMVALIIVIVMIFLVAYLIMRK